MRMGTIIGAILLAVLLAVAAWFYIDSLRSQLDLVGEELSHAKQGNTDRDTLIAQLREREQSNNLLRAHLEGERSAVQTVLRTRETLIRKLQRDNDEFRAWAAIAVPGPVSRMREHEVIVGAAAFRERMSKGAGLSPAGGDGGE
jgi:LysB family phage lysis regulatory protein